ncbi:hypothetical protein Tco_0179769 [Tanacetum coccineum]
MARRRVLESTEEIAPSTYEVGQSSRSMPEHEGAERLGSLPVSPSSPVVPSPIASPVATLAATISIDEDQFIEDLRELYTRSGAIRNEIFTQRYRFWSLEREQEGATVTFSAIWRRVLALEAREGQTDA